MINSKEISNQTERMEEEVLTIEEFAQINPSFNCKENNKNDNLNKSSNKKSKILNNRKIENDKKNISKENKNNNELKEEGEIEENCDSIVNKKSNYFPFWMNKLACNTKGLIKLHYEIFDYVNNILIPNSATEEKLNKTYYVLEKEIKHISSYFDIIPYGSYIQKLNTIKSDMDFTLIFSEDFNIKEFFGDDYNDDNNFYAKSSESYIGDILDFIKRRFIYDEFCNENEIEVITSARVPILKCKCQLTKIKIDLSICNIKSVKFSYKIKTIVEKEPLIRYTTILLKEILRHKNLNEVYKGGMSSLLLFELVCFYFQQYYTEFLCEIKKYNEDNNITSLGHFFYKFVEFFGVKFDYRTYQISLEDGGIISKKKSWRKEDTLYVMDISNEDNNLGQYCFDYNKIKNLFNKIYLFIKETPVNNVKSYLSSFIPKRDTDLLVVEQ